MGDVVYQNGQIIGHLGSTCNDDGDTYVGTQSQCVDGNITQTVYNGDCDAEYNGSFCCQSGMPGSAGGATCIKDIECDEYGDSNANRIAVNIMISCLFIILSTVCMIIV